MLAEHLRTEPGRLRGTSQRLTVLLRRYSEYHPELLARWLADPEEATGELPVHLRWQPELAAHVTETNVETSAEGVATDGEGADAKNIGFLILSFSVFL